MSVADSCFSAADAINLLMVKGCAIFCFLVITNITLISLITKWLQRTLYFFYE